MKRVLVDHKVEDGKLSKARPVLQRVVAEYPGSKVKTCTGDVFVVKPANEGSNLDGQHYQLVALPVH